MGKKKPFIDKKKSSTYHLLHRSQRDVAGHVAMEALQEGETRSQGMVLWPTGTTQNLPDTDQAVATRMTEWKHKLEAVGLLDVDHERYLKPITGTGTFLDARTGRATSIDTSASARQQKHQLQDAEESLLEVDRQLDSIPLSAEFMDEDIAAALFGDFDDLDYEELNDDFILEAAREPEYDDKGESFDFDNHIQQLLEKVARERQDRPYWTPSHGQNDAAYFSNLKPMQEEGSDDEDDNFSHFGTTVATEPGVVPKLNPDEERALCEKFEATLAEYDSDCSEGGHILGDLPQEDIHGSRALEGDAIIEAALDDFLQEKEDDIFIRGTRHREDGDEYTTKRGGSGFSVLVGTKMVPPRELDLANEHPEQEPVVPLEELLSSACERLALPKVKPPPEEIFIDGKSYFSERERNPWDCESILSTYSNLDNNPTTIGVLKSSRRRKQSKSTGSNVTGVDEPAQHIRLSAKTGLPISVLDQPIRAESDSEDLYLNDGNQTIFSINRGEARHRNETLEEKKARKLLVKRERELARIQKKMTKQVFAEEFSKRTALIGEDNIAGKTVFRFS